MQFFEGIGSVLKLALELVVAADDEEQPPAFEPLLEAVHVEFVQVTDLVDYEDHLVELGVLLEEDVHVQDDLPDF